MTILSHGLERERHGHQKQVRIGVAKKTDFHVTMM